MNAMLQIAINNVGVKEYDTNDADTSANNDGDEVRMYQSATWLKPGAWPWCAAFMCHCLKEAGKDESFLKLINHNATFHEAWRCKDASAFGWIKWAKRLGLKVFDEQELAKAGDIVVFDFSHIGIVEKDQLPGKDYIETIEGNTNGKGERDSVTGDGVWRKVRKTNLVKNYIRLA